MYADNTVDTISSATSANSFNFASNAMIISTLFASISANAFATITSKFSITAFTTASTSKYSAYNSALIFANSASNYANT